MSSSILFTILIRKLPPDTTINKIKNTGIIPIISSKRTFVIVSSMINNNKNLRFKTLVKKLIFYFFGIL